MKKINRKELNSLKEITRALFNKKRKKISNSLRDILDDDRLDKLDLDLNLRPDHLSLKDYLKISALLK
jgi:16S rRNA A1518/A1519 N6-dimethyltransferase RsmA/KsgA/DIM1 with predicted DNA glycosylase/AP lyase activity